jgi:hypothetical protein
MRAEYTFDNAASKPNRFAGRMKAGSITIVLDPDVAAVLERSRRWRDAYLRWGRDSLGFAVYLFYRPGARMG